VEAEAQAVAMLKERLKAAGVTDESKRVAKLIVDLDDDDFSVREKATQDLITIGKAAEQALRQALEKTASPEVRRRADEILDKLRTGTVSTPEGLRTPRAVAVLEEIGSSDAKALLEQLAKGASEAALTVEAKAALERMKATP
jgi:hypothetical protein